MPDLMPILSPPPHRSPFSDPGRCRRPIRRARIRPSDRGPLPRGWMPMMSLDNTDGWIRCGGVPTARRQDGHTHDWSGEGLRSEVPSRKGAILFPAKF